jgi:hypothetical protein
MKTSLETIVDFAHEIKVDVRISINIDKKYIVSLEADVCDGAFLRGIYGEGETIEEAALSYLYAIEGKTLYDTKRGREILVVNLKLNKEK